MKRINTPTSVDGRFVPGNSTTGQKATQLSAEWFNQVQEELWNFINKVKGSDPTGASDHELADAWQVFLTKMIRVSENDANPGFLASKFAVYEGGPDTFKSGDVSFKVVSTRSGTDSALEAHIASKAIKTGMLDDSIEIESPNSSAKIGLSVEGFFAEDDLGNRLEFGPTSIELSKKTNGVFVPVRKINFDGETTLNTPVTVERRSGGSANFLSFKLSATDGQGNPIIRTLGESGNGKMRLNIGSLEIDGAIDVYNSAMGAGIEYFTVHTLFKAICQAYFERDVNIDADLTVTGEVRLTSGSSAGVSVYYASSDVNLTTGGFVSGYKAGSVLRVVNTSLTSIDVTWMAGGSVTIPRFRYAEFYKADDNSTWYASV